VVASRHGLSASGADFSLSSASEGLAESRRPGEPPPPPVFASSPAGPCCPTNDPDPAGRTACPALPALPVSEKGMRGRALSGGRGSRPLCMRSRRGPHAPVALLSRLSLYPKPKQPPPRKPRPWAGLLRPSARRTSTPSSVSRRRGG